MTHTPSREPGLRLLTTAEAAEVLGVTHRFLEDRRHRGGPEGPLFVRLSRGAVRYRPQDLLSWIEANLEDGTTEVVDV